MKKLNNKNRLSIVRPDFSKEWDVEKNMGLTPKDVSFGSHKEVWWKCKNGHSWRAKINDRNNGCSCPYCSGHKVCPDNCLATINPKLVKEWNYKKNIGISPKDFTTGSNKKVWWKCKNGHEWVAQINNRNDGRCCPYCCNQKICKDNSLAFLNKNLCREWNYVKNKDLMPKNVGATSNKKVWWKCIKGHEWEANISYRASGGGCPYCSGHKVCSETCLVTKNPELAKEWNYDRNNKLTPKDVVSKSRKKVWWKCKAGHEWKSAICNRSIGGNGCPLCVKIILDDNTKFDSFTEAYFYLTSLKNKYKEIKINGLYKGFGKKRYDFYIPEINTYFEVTSYNKMSRGWGKKAYIFNKYMNKINNKKKHVENILKSNFKFVHLKLTNNDKVYVKKHRIN
jgi:hypothetical protein